MNNASQPWDVVKLGYFPPEQQVQIDREFRCHTLEAALADPGLLQRIQAIATRSDVKIPPETILALPNLKVVSTHGVGYDGIPLETAWSRGVVVTHTPNVLNAAVCELAIGILLGMLRRLPQADAFTRSGRWATEKFPLGESLSGKRVGIVGLGRIGKALAERLLPFWVSVAYNGRAKPDVPYRHIPDVVDLARDSDILFVSCRGGADTENLINAAVLKALGPKGYLINISRGSVVDEQALIQALAEGTIQAAGLDVYRNEPNVDPRLLDKPNTLLVPHMGSGTVETRQAMLNLFLDNLRAVLSGKPALTPVPRP